MLHLAFNQGDPIISLSNVHDVRVEGCWFEEDRALSVSAPDEQLSTDVTFRRNSLRNSTIITGSVDRLFVEENVLHRNRINGHGMYLARYRTGYVETRGNLVFMMAERQNAINNGPVAWRKAMSWWTLDSLLCGSVLVPMNPTSLASPM